MSEPQRKRRPHAKGSGYELRVLVTKKGHPILFEELSRVPDRARAEWIRSHAQSAVRLGTVEIIERIIGTIGGFQTRVATEFSDAAQAEKPDSNAEQREPTPEVRQLDARSAAVSGAMDDVEL